MGKQVNIDLYSGDEENEMEIYLMYKHDSAGRVYLGIDEAEELLKELKNKIELMR